MPGISESNQSLVHSVIEKQIQDLESQALPKSDFNKLALYFGDDYVVNDRIKIRQPTIQDYIDIGETNMYSTIAPFTSNPTSFRVQLWDMGVDWNKITDFELFAMLIKTIEPEYSKLLFYDIDFPSFDFVAKRVGEEKVPVLYSSTMDMEIDEQTYKKIFDYMCYMFNIHPDVEHCTGRTFKEELINNDRLKAAKRAAEGHESNLLSMISFALNHPGFKYKKNELREIGIVEFMDSIQRLQIYESTHALMSGMYSGFCDTSKIDKSQFDFMRDATISA